ncbi:MAG: alanine racemase, partial [Gemmatimonadetes bacterium]|nr:alanine racemase [Gemmatimonadota bacterium]
MSSDNTRTQTRRRFLEIAGGFVAAAGATGCASGGARPVPAGRAAPLASSAATPADRFDPWVEIDAAAYRHNAREAAKLAGGRPILAVVKNNAYGIGDQAVGPLLAGFPEVGGIACVRVEEAVAMREAGVTKPIVVMAEQPDDAIAEMAHHDVLPSVWLDDAPERLARVARRLGRPVPIQMFVDTGMNREGMPFRRARPWIEALCASPSVEVNGTYTMFSHDLDFDRVQLERFESLLGWARENGLDLGTIHASPTTELFHL